MRDLTIAFALREASAILARVSDDIQWNRVGVGTTVGKPALIELIKGLSKDDVLEIHIQHAFTHGKGGAVNGLMKMKNCSTFGFCDIYDFKSVKGDTASVITSYPIELL